MKHYLQQYRTTLIATSAAILAILAFSLAGCSTVPPTGVEQGIFDIRTNYVPVVHTVTNYIPVTNTVIAYVTNQAQQVIEVPEIVVTTLTNTSFLTNFFETTTWTTKTNVTAAVGAAGSIINTFAPGIGSLIAAIIAGGLGIWGTARQKNKQIGGITQTAATLAQIIQVGRELLASTPQGAQAADAWKEWMVKHETEQGVTEQVIELLKLSVNKPDASYVADKLLALMKDVQNKP